MPQTIFINGRFLTQPTTGVQRFALELLTALDSILERSPESLRGAQLVCLIPRKGSLIVQTEWKHIQIQQCGQLRGNLWEQIELPFFAYRGLLLDLCNIGPLFHRNQIVVIHDASVFAVPDAYSLTFKAKYRLIMNVLGRTAKRIVTVSGFSKSELVRYLHIRAERISVIPEGCEHILRAQPDDAILEKRNLSDRAYLLAVGSLSPHKNIKSVISAIERSLEISSPLIIAGGSFAKVFKEARIADSQKIVLLGYVTDAELRALYKHAAGFIFPSVYEGFGLPPLEAMVCGCPVICSDRASMPEICGDAALYFDPIDEDEIVSQIQRVLVSPSLQAELRQKGRIRVAQFSWEKAARVMIDLLKEEASANQ
jgi:Glycosyltransferase